MSSWQFGMQHDPIKCNCFCAKYKYLVHIHVLIQRNVYEDTSKMCIVSCTNGNGWTNEKIDIVSYKKAIREKKKNQSIIQYS